jgi:hypothetical protein
MNLHLARPARPFPVADRTRDGELYRTMHPRLAAIDLLRDKCVDGKAGVDVYDPSVFIVDALPHEIVWVRRCLLLCGSVLGERDLGRGRIRYRGILADDVKADLDLAMTPPRYVIRDEPLASRGVDSPLEAILDVMHPDRLRVADDDVAPSQFRPALERARQAAALRVDCGCGAPAGQVCRCDDVARMTSALPTRNEVH